jgi:hypothetical protein
VQRVYVGDPFEAIAKAKTGLDGRSSTAQGSPAVPAAAAPAASSSKHPPAEGAKPPAPPRAQAAALPPLAAGAPKAGAPLPSFSTVTAQQPAAKAGGKPRAPHSDSGSVLKDERQKGGVAAKAALPETGAPKSGLPHQVWAWDAFFNRLFMLCRSQARGMCMNGPCPDVFV